MGVIKRERVAEDENEAMGLLVRRPLIHLLKIGCREHSYICTLLHLYLPL